MAVKTVTFQRYRSELKVFRQENIADIETDYNAYETAEAADTGFTYAVRVVSAGFDGEKFWLIAEKTWPEINEDPTDQVPPAP